MNLEDFCVINLTSLAASILQFKSWIRTKITSFFSLKGIKHNFSIMFLSNFLIKSKLILFLILFSIVFTFINQEFLMQYPQNPVLFRSEEHTSELQSPDHL